MRNDQECCNRVPPEAEKIRDKKARKAHKSTRVEESSSPRARITMEPEEMLEQNSKLEHGPIQWIDSFRSPESCDADGSGSEAWRMPRPARYRQMKDRETEN